MILKTFSVIFRKMSSLTSALVAPVGLRGMTVLDREKFSQKFKVPVLKVNSSNEDFSKITQLCRPYFLKLENFKPVQNIEDDGDFKKIVYMNPERVTEWTSLEEKHREMLHQQNITGNNFTIKEIELGYSNWSFDTIFKAVLPENEEIVSSFSQVGHIIHLNLREHLLEYRSLIGQVLVDKIKTCHTVVNKSNIIDNTYRNFSMEVIAGEEDFLVTVKENNCQFQFDFSKVYWNPRLGKEHERILSYLKPKDVLFDVFCGVGPFSVPAGRRKCIVFANDLNPDSYKWLNHNTAKNKVKNLQAFNKDGKDFIRDNFKDFIVELCKGNQTLDENNKIHVTMNLPAMAVEFLKYFKGLIEDESLLDKFKWEIIVYVYCFVNEDPVNSAKKLVSEHMDCDMTMYIKEVFSVRKVSPKKEMMRVTLNLTKDILFDSVNEPPSKKLCVE